MASRDDFAARRVLGNRLTQIALELEAEVVDVVPVAAHHFAHSFTRHVQFNHIHWESVLWEETSIRQYAEQRPLLHSLTDPLHQARPGVTARGRLVSFSLKVIVAIAPVFLLNACDRRYARGEEGVDPSPAEYSERLM
jgi:hypothetical protein